MIAKIKIQSTELGQIDKFLQEFYNTNLNIKEKKYWEKEYKNPVELSDIISAYIDNSENFNIKLWICLDKNVFINVTEENANEIIRYLFERYPY